MRRELSSAKANIEALGASPRNFRFGVAIAFLAIVFLTGGSSRADAQSQILVRLAAIITITIALIGLRHENLIRVRTPLLFLGLLSVLIAIQLVPLPPVLWAMLPGHDAFLPLLRVAGVDQVWRPISLTPDLTINALFALLPPAAAIFLLSRLSTHSARLLLIPIIGLIILSGLLGLLQLSSGDQSFYFYRITNNDAAVGFFANRNHQGMMLALALPMLAVVAARSVHTEAEVWKFWMILGLGVFVVPLIMVTGSRAALVLALIGGIAAWLLYGPARSAIRRKQPARKTLLPALVWVGAVALVGIAAVSSRAVSIQRLFSEDVSQEVRLSLFGPMLEMGLEYFPVGTGFGAFVDVFKMNEPISNVSGTYLNHAHNDLLEVFIEAGLPGLLLVAAFCVWFTRTTFAVWRRRTESEGRHYARLGSVIIVMIMLASLGDYPLRTPIFMVLFAINVSWMVLTDRGSTNSGKVDARLYQPVPSD